MQRLGSSSVSEKRNMTWSNISANIMHERWRADMFVDDAAAFGYVRQLCYQAGCFASSPPKRRRMRIGSLPTPGGVHKPDSRATFFGEFPLEIIWGRPLATRILAILTVENANQSPHPPREATVR